MNHNMNEREYLAVCQLGHRSYLRLRSWDVLEAGRCQTCGAAATLTQLPDVILQALRQGVTVDQISTDEWDGNPFFTHPEGAST